MKAGRKETGVAIGGDADDRAVLAFRKLGAVGRDQEREMRELRQGGVRRLCGFEDQDVLEGVGEMILAADDVADVEIDVVGAGRHVIGRDAVAAEQREVFDVGGGFGLQP